MATPAARIGFLQFVFFTGLGAIVARAVQLQVVEGKKWARVADKAHVVAVDGFQGEIRCDGIKRGRRGKRGHAGGRGDRRNHPCAQYPLRGD